MLMVRLRDSWNPSRSIEQDKWKHSQWCRFSFLQPWAFWTHRPTDSAALLHPTILCVSPGRKPRAAFLTFILFVGKQEVENKLREVGLRAEDIAAEKIVRNYSMQLSIGLHSRSQYNKMNYKNPAQEIYVATSCFCTLYVYVWLSKATTRMREELTARRRVPFVGVARDGFPFLSPHPARIHKCSYKISSAPSPLNCKQYSLGFLNCRQPMCNSWWGNERHAQFNLLVC